MTKSLSDIPGQRMKAANIAYIVGGGRSLLGYDWNLLRDKYVIAINRAFEVLPFARIIYFTDHYFFKEYKDKGLLEHGAALVSISDRIYDKRVILFEDVGPAGLSLEPGKLKNGANSGYAAINLAVLLGFGTIVLLGFDMHCSLDFEKVALDNGNTVLRKAHWHEGYNRNVNSETYDKMLKYFPTLVSPLKEAGVTVLNANPDSRITCFPIIDLNTAHLVGEMGAEETA